MLNGLFHTMESERAAEGYCDAVAEALENGEIRDMYMGTISEALDGIDESELASTAEAADMADIPDDLDDQVDSLGECGSSCSESDYEGDSVDEFDPAIAKTIDALPPSDPEDVGTFFNDAETAAECGGSCKESFDSIIDQLPDTCIDY